MGAEKEAVTRGRSETTYILVQQYPYILIFQALPLSL